MSTASAPWFLDLLSLLESKGYPTYASEHIVEHLAVHGDADVGPALLDPADRAAVERIAAVVQPRWVGRTDCEAISDNDATPFFPEARP